MIPQIQQVVVEDKGWMTKEEMIDCIAVSQSMPGVIAINSATYIGKTDQRICRCGIGATRGCRCHRFSSSFSWLPFWEW